MSSSDIIPYNTCIDGIKESIGGSSLKIVNINKNLQEGYRSIENFQNEGIRLFIGVGPQAAYVMSKSVTSTHRIFCMVLHPEKILGTDSRYPGVSLNIPPYHQIEKIKEAFPLRKRIGIFFGPESNQSLVDVFSHEAAKRDLSIVTFPISSANDIPDIINSQEFSIDVLLVIPDVKLKSTKIVEYIIQETLRKKIPLVGYNSWFAKNGAILSFIINKRDIGIQTGEIAKDMLESNEFINLRIQPPKKVSISINLKTAKKLGVEISQTIISQADEVID